ncbi:hypothetical protein Tco_0104492 [Tanacetum coccineum]
MTYPRFTKIIINHFILQNKSISMRNKINLHTARDDSILGALNYVSKIEEHQVYGALIPKEMLNEDILISTAYKTSYAYASGAKDLKKARKFKKPASPKLKIVPVSPKEPTKKPRKFKKDVTSTKKTATKPKPTKKKAPVKADRGKGDGTDFELGVLDEQQCKISGIDEGTGTKPRVPDVPKYDSDSNKVSWGDSGEEDDDKDDTKDDDDNDGNDDGDDSYGNDDNDSNDDDDASDHERTESDRDENLNLNQSNEEHKEEEAEYVDEFTDKEDDADNGKEENEEELDDVEELYKDVNVNLRKEDVEMTDADQGGVDQHNVSQESGFEQEEEDAHVTLTTVHDTQKTEGPIQSSSVSSDFREKLLNFENVSPADIEIASLMDNNVRHEEPSGQTYSLYNIPVTVIPEITSAFTTTIPPPPPSFNPLLYQATLTPTPTTSEVTNSFAALPNFASVFRFNDRVTNMERDRYIDNKLGEGIQQATKSHTVECREEALADRREYIDLIDKTERATDFNPLVFINII